MSFGSGSSDAPVCTVIEEIDDEESGGEAEPCQRIIEMIVRKLGPCRAGLRIFTRKGAWLCINDEGRDKGHIERCAHCRRIAHHPDILFRIVHTIKGSACSGRAEDAGKAERCVVCAFRYTAMSIRLFQMRGDEAAIDENDSPFRYFEWRDHGIAGRAFCILLEIMELAREEAALKLKARIFFLIGINFSPFFRRRKGRRISRHPLFELYEKRLFPDRKSTRLNSS